MLVFNIINNCLVTIQPLKEESMSIAQMPFLSVSDIKNFAFMVIKHGTCLNLISTGVDFSLRTCSCGTCSCIGTEVSRILRLVLAWSTQLPRLAISLSYSSHSSVVSSRTVRRSVASDWTWNHCSDTSAIFSTAVVESQISPNLWTVPCISLSLSVKSFAPPVIT